MIITLNGHRYAKLKWWRDMLASGKYRKTTRTLVDANGARCCWGVVQCELQWTPERLHHLSPNTIMDWLQSDWVDAEAFRVELENLNDNYPDDNFAAVITHLDQLLAEAV